MIDDYKEEIIERYLRGETALSISKTLPFHNSTISRYLHKWGVSRGQISKNRFDNEENIVKDFLTGDYYCEELSKKYGLEVHTIYDILDKNNIKRQTGIKSKCNEGYFEQIDNPNKAYLLGFITADGSVANGHLSIEVHEKDKGLILFAREQINPEVKVTPIKYHALTQTKTGKIYESYKNDIRVAFGSKKLGQSLAKYGIVQNKSKTIQKVPVDFVQDNLLPFFFRGLIDGDGCIHKDGKVSIYSGSRPFIENVRDILVEKVGVASLKIYHGTSYFVTWASKKDKSLLFHYLYDNLDATYYYPRKYERLLESISSYANTEVTD